MKNCSDNALKEKELVKRSMNNYFKLLQSIYLDFTLHLLSFKTILSEIG